MIRAPHALAAIAALVMATAATAQDGQAQQGTDAQSVAPAPINPPKGGAGAGASADAPTMSNVDKPAPAAAKAPAGAAKTAGASNYTDIPFQKGDPEAPGNPAGDRRTHINASVAWQKHWQDRGFEKVTDPASRSVVILDGTAY